MLAESSQGQVPGTQTCVNVRLGQGAGQARMIRTMGIIRRRTGCPRGRNISLHVLNGRLFSLAGTDSLLIKHMFIA